MYVEKLFDETIDVTPPLFLFVVCYSFMPLVPKMCVYLHANAQNMQMAKYIPLI